MGGAAVSRRFGLYGTNSRDFLTYGGRVLWHDNAAELAYLFPVGTATVREIPAYFPDELLMRVRDHPRMAAVRFPLTREQFRNPN